jgi:hypothetical protein
MFCPFGSPIQRSFTAPSDQNAALGVYGMSPLAGIVGLDSFTQPVADSCEATPEAATLAEPVIW